jgi:hypothetical protein
MVWEVLGSSKKQVGAYGIRAKGDEEAPIKIKTNFLEDLLEGGRNSSWRA